MPILVTIVGSMDPVFNGQGMEKTNELKEPKIQAGDEVATPDVTITTSYIYTTVDKAPRFRHRPHVSTLPVARGGNATVYILGGILPSLSLRLSTKSALLVFSFLS